MNGRGLDLTTTDILKPEIMGAAPEGAAAGLAKRWETIEGAMGDQDFQELFSLIRFIFGRSELRGSVLNRFREQVLAPLQGEFGEEFMQDVLEPYSQAYEFISDMANARDKIGGTGGIEQVNDIVIILQNLGELDGDTWKPAVMYAFNRRGDFRGENPPWPDFLEFLKKYEAIAFSLALRRASKSERAQRFAGVLNELDAYFGGGQAIVDFFELTTDEIAETNTALNGRIYRQGSKVMKPLLLLLDRAKTGEGAEYATRTISIEHVLPQTLPENGTWRGHFTEKEHEQWVHKLANLVLLSRRRNTAASNFGFAKKKNTYFFRDETATPFTLTNSVQGIAQWTPAVLEQRQQDLIDCLQKRWGMQAAAEA